MSVVALASVKASPGVTTSLLALAATWPAHRPVLLVEADPDGGDLAARAGLPPEPGLTSLATSGRRALADGELDRHVQSLPGGCPSSSGPLTATTRHGRSTSSPSDSRPGWPHRTTATS